VGKVETNGIFSSIFGAMDIASRPDICQTASMIIMELALVHQKEKSYGLRIPANLQVSEVAIFVEESIDLATDAINTTMLDIF
jgi:hypothetical protein